MKNIFLIPTDIPSRLAYYQESTSYNKPILQLVSTTSSDYKYQNIYITNDEEIKDECWIMPIDGVPYKLVDLDCILESDRKIILTTDQDLIKDGVQAIDDEFLEWFVKNPSCESVEVKLNYLGSKCLKCGYIENHDEVDTNCCPKCSNTTYKHLYENKIIIPKEEPKQCCDSGIVNDFCINTLKCKHAVGGSKQETLEEAKQRVLKANYMSANDGDIFEMGAKWQAERMYSEEEMISFAEFVATYPDKNRNVYGEMLHSKSKYDGAERTIDLLEQFKKK